MNYFTIVSEDRLSAAVIEKLLSLAPFPICIHRRLGEKGCGYIRSHIKDLLKAAKHQKFFILMDSDNEDCALRLVNSLVPEKLKTKNCIFRIAVREIEAWILADGPGIGKFLGVSERKLTRMPEKLPDPKKYLVDFARRSRNRNIREGLIPSEKTSAVIGPEYNVMLSDFVKNFWNAERAAEHSESLRRAVAAIKNIR